MLQPYLDSITHWATRINLILNTNKTQTTLFTPDPAEYSKSLNLSINNNILATNPFPIILGLTLDPKLTFSEHVKYTKTKAYKTIYINKIQCLSVCSTLETLFLKLFANFFFIF